MLVGLERTRGGGGGKGDRVQTAMNNNAPPTTGDNTDSKDPRAGCPAVPAVRRGAVREEYQVPYLFRSPVHDDAPDVSWGNKLDVAARCTSGRYTVGAVASLCRGSYQTSCPGPPPSVCFHQPRDVVPIMNILDGRRKEMQNARP